jgi:hypothetical protein
MADKLLELWLFHDVVVLASGYLFVSYTWQTEVKSAISAEDVLEHTKHGQISQITVFIHLTLECKSLTVFFPSKMYPLQLKFIPTLLSYEDYHIKKNVKKAVHQ